jgi:hypothetical protein
MATAQAAIKQEPAIPANEFSSDDDPLVVVETESAVEVDTELDVEDRKASAPAVDPKIETEARDGGWVSKEEWVETHGSERGWKSAEDYVDFRRAFVPILSKDNKALREEVRKLKEQLDKRDADEAASRVEFQKQSLQLELRQARENNDWDKADEIAGKLLDLKLAEKPKAVPSAQPVDPQVQQDFLAFQERNAWIKTDQRLARIFGIQLKSVMEMDPTTPVPEALEQARDMTKRLYPEKFPRRTAMAESGGDAPAGSRRQVSWSQLKPDVRQTYEKFIEDTPGLTRELLLKRFARDNPEFFRS